MQLKTYRTDVSGCPPVPKWTMKPLRCLSLQFLLKIAAVLGLLGMLALLRQPRTAWNPSYIFSYSWLDYTDNGGGPESACDCVAILRGDVEEIEKAKLLTITRDFRRSVRVPDEYYINATRDCRCAAIFKPFCNFTELTWTQDSFGEPILSRCLLL